MSAAEEQLRIEFPRPEHYEVQPQSRLGQTLRGLDPFYALGTLPGDQQAVLESRFGIIDGTPKLQKDVASELSMQPSRVSRLEIKAIGRLAALREMYRPEKAFYLYRDSLYIDGGTYWEDFPGRMLHHTWEDSEILRLVEEGKYRPRYNGDPSEAREVG